MTPPQTHLLSPVLIATLVGLLIGLVAGVALCSPHWPAAGQPPYGDGIHAVGHDLQPGTYHTEGGEQVCDWERLSDLTGSNAAVLAINAQHGPQTVQVLATDAGFQTDGCCEWTRVA